MSPILYSDTHHGVHPVHTQEWMDVCQEFHQKFMLPLLTAKPSGERFVLHLGDLFDNRSSLDISVMNRTMDIFQSYHDAGVEHWILVGNHDMWNERSRQVNSLNALRCFSSVRIIDEPVMETICGKRVGFVPFTHSAEEQLAAIRRLGAGDHLMTHCDLRGAYNNARVRNEGTKLKHGLGIESYSEWGRVWSGHIHIRQKVRNFQYIGCPYHLDRNDIGDDKGAWELDLGTGDAAFIENTVSPRFRIVEVSTLEGADALKKSNTGRQDRIDLVVNKSALAAEPKLRESIEDLARTVRLSRVDVVDDIYEKPENNATLDMTGSLDIKSLVMEHLAASSLDEDSKASLLLKAELVFDTHARIAARETKK